MRAPKRVRSSPSQSAVTSAAPHRIRKLRKAGKLRMPRSICAGQPARRTHRLRGRPPDIGHRRDRHENQPHRHQHLVEFVAAVEPPVQQALDRQAAERGGHRGGGERRHERHARPAHQTGDDIAAQHREDAVRQIDKAHQPHRHRQPDRYQVQHHRKGEAVEADADGGRNRVGKCQKALVRCRGNAVSRVIAANRRAPSQRPPP